MPTELGVGDAALLGPVLALDRAVLGALGEPCEGALVLASIAQGGQGHRPPSGEGAALRVWTDS